MTVTSLFQWGKRLNYIVHKSNNITVCHHSSFVWSHHNQPCHLKIIIFRITHRGEFNCPMSWWRFTSVNPANDWRESSWDAAATPVPGQVIRAATHNCNWCLNLSLHHASPASPPLWVSDTKREKEKNVCAFHRETDVCIFYCIWIWKMLQVKVKTD